MWHRLYFYIDLKLGVHLYGSECWNKSSFYSKVFAHLWIPLLIMFAFWSLWRSIESSSEFDWSFSSVITITHLLNWPAWNQKMETDRLCVPINNFRAMLAGAGEMEVTVRSIGLRCQSLCMVLHAKHFVWL